MVGAGEMDTRSQELRPSREGEHCHGEERSLCILRSITSKDSKASKHCWESCERMMSNFDSKVHPWEPLGHRQTGAMGHIITSDPLSSTSSSLTICFNLSRLHIHFTINQKEAQINHFNICIS